MGFNMAYGLLSHIVRVSRATARSSWIADPFPMQVIPGAPFGTVENGLAVEWERLRGIRGLLMNKGSILTVTEGTKEGTVEFAADNYDAIAPVVYNMREHAPGTFTMVSVPSLEVEQLAA